MGRPAYRQLADILRERIESGQYQQRRPLPSELHLRQEFGVARDTIRRALALLADWGLVRTIGGRGTFVRAVDRVTVRMEPGLRVFSRPAVAAERVTLDLAEGAYVIVIERRDGVEVLPADSTEILVIE